MIEAHSEDPGRRQAKRKALFFTLIVHLGLVLALFLGVQWKSSQPEVMEVELWSPRPTPATAPPPPKPEPRPEPKEEAPKPKPEPRLEPKPEPKKPEIVVKEEKKKPEPKKPEPPKPEPPKPEPKKPEPKKSEPVKPEPAKPVSDPFKEMLERETRQRQSNEVSRLAAQAEAEQRAAAGRGVRLAASPMPIAGCISRKGAATVSRPTNNAGPRRGCCNHAAPKTSGNSAAKAIPMA